MPFRDYSTPLPPELPPEGGYIGQICHVIDLGQQVTTYQGTQSLKPMIALGVKVHNLVREDGKPWPVKYLEYTNSFADSAHLRKLIENLYNMAITEEMLQNQDGMMQAFTNLPTRPVWVDIRHAKANSGKLYAEWTISRPQQPVALSSLPPLGVPIIILDLTVEGFSAEDFELLPKWIKDKILKSLTWKQFQAEQNQPRVQLPPEGMPAHMRDVTTEEIPF